MNPNHKINKSLITYLIRSDFIFLDSVYKKKVALAEFSAKSGSFSVSYQLQLLDVLKTFKQFIRFLQYANIKKGSLGVWASNSQTYNLLRLFFKERNTPFELSRSFSKKGLRSYSFRPTLVLDSPLRGGPNFFQFLARSNFTLIQQINPTLEINNWGTYKIYNSLKDFKKTLFVGILLDQILKQ